MFCKLQNLFIDLNDELAKHSENKLSERTLTGRILFTLGKERDSFKDVWDTVPTSKQTLNLLIEELCAIELRADKLASAEATAFVAPEKDKKSNSTKGNSSKSTKRKLIAGNKFPCNKCKQLGHWAMECPQKQQHAGDRGTSAANNADAFLVHVMGLQEQNCGCGQLVL